MVHRLTLTVATAALLAATAGPAPASAQELVFSSWGGAYQDAIRQAWLEPFMDATGIEVLEDTGPETAKVRAMVETSTVSWDVVTGGGATLMRGVGLDLFEPITPEMVDQSHLYEGARSAWGVPSEIFSTVFAFNTETFPASGAQPQTWADFWDVETFPGQRSVYDRPQTVLEAALLADGVALDDLYAVLSTSEGQDRAFAKLAELKPHVSVWWRSGAQPVQALASGEAVMALGWNGRFQAGLDNDLPLQMVWDGAIAQVGFFMIVKGAPNQDAAVQFLNYVAQPEAQSRFHQFIKYGPTTPQAWAFIPESEWALLPSSPQNIERSVFLDIEWWAENDSALMERYAAFLQN